MCFNNNYTCFHACERGLSHHLQSALDFQGARQRGTQAVSPTVLAFPTSAVV